MKEYYGNYLGIVIQNNDPLARGRVKIFVPHVSPTVYKNWNEIPEDKKFKFLGANIDSDLNNIVEDLKKMLPWSICASPITGEMSSGRLNAFPNYASNSDSSFSGLSGFQADETNLKEQNNDTAQQNIDLIGEKEGNVYEKYRFKVNDAFNSSDNNVNNVNINSFDYTPSVYSNKVKGSFAVPSVGAHVWVFFHDGDPLFPVYFAASYGQFDWEQMYGGKSGYDYPGGFENRSLSATNESDVEYYKNKYIINQKGGTIEFVNSDYRESLKISGYNGSFKQFALKTNVELATHDDQKLVLQDQYDTVRGFRNIYTERDLDYIVRGDYYLKTGNLKEEYFKEWHDIVASLANIKQLFETKRAEKFEAGQFLKLTSTLQEREGEFAPCPVCLGSTGKEYLVTNDEAAKFNPIGALVNRATAAIGFLPDLTVSPLNGKGPSLTNLPPTSRCPVCNGTGISPSSEGGSWVEDPRKTIDAYRTEYKKRIVQLADIEKKMGLGGNYIIDVTKNKVENIGLVMNDFGNVRVDSVGKITNSSVNLDELGAYVGMKESPMFEYVHVDDMPGGSYSLNVASRFNIAVGSGGINMKSYGAVDISGTITNVAGEQLNLSSEFETNISGGKRLSLEADIVSIKNKQGGQVLIDSNLGVNGNAIIKGGLHVDGELSVNHVTAPLEIQETEGTQIFGETVPLLKIGTVTITRGSSKGVYPVLGGGVPNSVIGYYHSHKFANLPLDLKQSNEQVRKEAKANQNPITNPAKPLVNRKK